MDVGQATSKDIGVGKSAQQVVMLASPAVHIEEGHNGGEMGMEDIMEGRWEWKRHLWGLDEVIQQLQEE